MPDDTITTTSKHKIYHHAAEQLASARRTGVKLSRTLEGIHSVADGYAVQRVVAFSDRQTKGWKVGPARFNDFSKWRMNEPGTGPIFDVYRGNRASPGTIDAKVAGYVGVVEAEVGLVFSKSLPPKDTPYTHAEVWDAVDKVAATFELVGSRLGYNSPSPAHIVADCTNNVAIVVGDTRSAASLRVSDLARVRVEISVLENDGHPTKLARGIGHAGAFKEHPIESATWLANRLPRIIPGACIRAGDVVVTGAATLTKDVRPGATYVASFGGIGHVACTLARGEKAATARL